MKPMPADDRFMKRALALARRGAGKTSPNPYVGALVVRAGKIVGEGWHRQAGGPHAEVFALRAAGKRSVGATLYVTLEPCSTHGRTPPCTEAIIAAGIRRVVVGGTDPNPRHRGRGLRILRRAGIQVVTGVLADEATRLNEAFNKWIVSRLPQVTIKAAMSLDGKIATHTGNSQWITSPVARREAHRLRAGVDAVAVSVGTVIADDPQLSLRHGVKGRQPWRVVVDGRGRCPTTAKLVTDRLRHRTIVVTTAHSKVEWRRYLALLGIIVLVVEADGEHVELRAMLRALGEMEITSVLVEGGGDFIGALLEMGLADRVAFFYAPKIIGGRDAKTGVDGTGVTKVMDAWSLTDVNWRVLPGGEQMVTGAVKR